MVFQTRIALGQKLYVHSVRESHNLGSFETSDHFTSLLTYSSLKHRTQGSNYEVLLVLESKRSSSCELSWARTRTILQGPGVLSALQTGGGTRSSVVSQRPPSWSLLERERHVTSRSCRDTELHACANKMKNKEIKKKTLKMA